jgi:hypothetical protein
MAIVWKKRYVEEFKKQFSENKKSRRVSVMCSKCSRESEGLHVCVCPARFNVAAKVGLVCGAVGLDQGNIRYCLLGFDGIAVSQMLQQTAVRHCQ